MSENPIKNGKEWGLTLTALIASGVAMNYHFNDGGAVVALGAGPGFSAIFDESPTAKFIAAAGLVVAGIAVEVLATDEYTHNTALGLFGSASYLAGSGIQSLRTLDRAVVPSKAEPKPG